MRWLPLVASAASLPLASAVSGIDAWLRYARVPNAEGLRSAVPDSIVALNQSSQSPVYTAGQELKDGIAGILGQDCELGWHHGPHGRPPHGGWGRPGWGRSGRGGSKGTITVGTVDQFANASISVNMDDELVNDGYHVSISGSNVYIVGSTQRGALYGAFNYLNNLSQGTVPKASYTSNPDAPIRWVNQWDNLQDGGTHGSVERGYGGESIFFWDGGVREDLSRVPQFARLLASVGINGVIINNVNANESMVEPRIISGVKRIADLMRPYGVQVGMSLNFATPQLLGVLDTFDPLDESVIAFWENRTTAIYDSIPDFAGYLIKASSEGQPGPLTYNRTLAQGANVFANALLHHGGTCMFRAFVYDSTSLNETHWREDRANAAVDFFSGLDGEFDENVVLQIKYGPIDFQVREPASPLFGHLNKTPKAIELEITQEYLGQQDHVMYFAGLWNSVLGFDLRIDGKESYVRDIVSGQRFGHSLGGYAGVSNVGTNQTWLGSHMAMANLYLFGQLAWNPTVDTTKVIEDWTRLTFNSNQDVVDTVRGIALEAWPTYENYTGNLGIQTLTNILNAHYGPDPASQDGNPWGQWTRADGFSIGMDRTIENGTRFSGQYAPEVTAVYNSLDNTPDDLLLWFHHVNYTYVMHSGETVIQHFYNAHYAGFENAQTFVPRWAALEGKMDAQQWSEELHKFVYQAGHSIVWRDTICNFYYNLSGIPDDAGRVGHHPYRIEAEDMDLENYEPYDVIPWNSASGEKHQAIVTTSNSTTGTASAKLSNIESGTYDLAVNYFDLAIGRATWTLYLDDTKVGWWVGDSDVTLSHAPVLYVDGQTATRITFPGVKVEKGQTLKVVGEADGQEPAPLDYVSIMPEGMVD